MDTCICLYFDFILWCGEDLSLFCSFLIFYVCVFKGFYEYSRFLFWVIIVSWCDGLNGDL